MKWEGKSIPEFSSADPQQFEQATLSPLCKYYLESCETRSMEPKLLHPIVVPTPQRKEKCFRFITHVRFMEAVKLILLFNSF
jgi:hypothetical protein